MRCLHLSRDFVISLLRRFTHRLAVPLGAMSEFERALIQERVRAGLRNARAKGKRLGRPPVLVDADEIASPRAQGRSWSQIVSETGLGKETVQRAFAALPKIA
jgi:DNA invertase Pin-like site-specific DNA recombinase